MKEELRLLASITELKQKLFTALSIWKQVHFPLCGACLLLLIPLPDTILPLTLSFSFMILAGMPVLIKEKMKNSYTEDSET